MFCACFDETFFYLQMVNFRLSRPTSVIARGFETKHIMVSRSGAKIAVQKTPARCPILRNIIFWAVASVRGFVNMSNVAE